VRGFGRRFWGTVGQKVDTADLCTAADGIAAGPGNCLWDLESLIQLVHLSQITLINHCLTVRE